MLSQGKFVFAIFACGHEFLASDDASCAYQKHGGRLRQLASRHQLATDSDLLRIDFGREMLKCDRKLTKLQRSCMLNILLLAEMNCLL